MNIIITSKNPIKREATRLAYQKLFPAEELHLKPISVASNVKDQPMSSKETLLGAKNRVDAAISQNMDADFYVGIEGGIELDNKEHECFAWVVISDGKHFSKAKTGSFYLPKPISDLIENGMELGHANDQFFHKKNSKQDNGAVGILTKDIITRNSYYEHAITLGLIPFINPELYFNI